MKRLAALFIIIGLLVPSMSFGVKISDLTALTTVAGGDLMLIVDMSEADVNDQTKKITWTSLMAAPGAIGATTPAAGTFTDIVAVTTLNPSVGNTVDLGTALLEFQDAFLSGTVTAPIYNAGKDSAQSGSITIHHGGTLTLWDSDNDWGPSLMVTNGTPTLKLTNGTFEASANLIAGGALLPDAADGATIGTALLEWSDLYFADGAIVYFGDDQEVTLTHVADTGLALNLNLTVGAIASSTLTITASADDTDVSGVNTLFINPGAAVVIGGFTGGVAGQVLYVQVVDADQTVTLEDQEGVGGTQQIYMHASGDEAAASERAGWVLICDGASWYDVSHAKHV